MLRIKMLLLNLRGSQHFVGRDRQPGQIRRGIDGVSGENRLCPGVSLAIQDAKLVRRGVDDPVLADANP